MKLGIIPNTNKENIVEVVELLLSKLKGHDFKSTFSSDFQSLVNENHIFDNCEFLSNEDLFTNNDLIVSIGGDGTLLTTSFDGRKYGTPMLGINFGKLGFLAEYEINNLDRLITELENGDYVIEERMTLCGECSNGSEGSLFATNDIVIDKGHWPKMIEIELRIDDKYVSTFSADGIIISTPTGSTGYSLSVGGPIVNPIAKAITISPISPHTLTMRPLVVGDNQKVSLVVKSEFKKIHVSCDGQRVTQYNSPKEFIIYSSKTPIKLLRTKSTSYYEILRNKLYWGVDIRKNNVKENDV
ncbi:MAG: NAD(+)/NADH kinase [Bacteroidetes bacterium]|nr:NAD(+)/NADH kinase [Bacteroidota bacterium]MBU1114879.1 NAD(+)/NADH kinase [Bacteroidota bacterium]MBU1798811.1 NAD(+)/NADH kinase [Bacteroidota bacterium]